MPPATGRHAAVPLPTGCRLKTESSAMRQGQGSERDGSLVGRMGRGYPASTVAAVLGCGLLLPVAAQEITFTPLQPQAISDQALRVAVNIPAQPLLSALRAFGLQTQSQVLFHEALLAGRQADAVYGSFTPQEALERLLARTGLVIATARARSFTLKLAQIQGVQRLVPGSVLVS